MRGAPEVKAWAEGGGYKVTVYREVKGGAAYRKIGEYGKESGKRAGFLWKKRRVYMVMLEKEGEVGGSAASKRGNKKYGRRAPARGILVGSNREQSVASNNSRPSTCGVGSVGGAESNDVEQQRKAAWGWQRREDTLEGAGERAGNAVVLEHMDEKDVDSLWAVLCVLEGKSNSVEELIRQVWRQAWKVDTRRVQGRSACHRRKSHRRGTSRERHKGDRWEDHRTCKHGRRRGDTK